jgi:hypothetical protein
MQTSRDVGQIGKPLPTQVGTLPKKIRYILE